MTSQTGATSGDRTGLVSGVLPVISTPFTADDAIDESVLVREVEWLVSCEVDGLTIAMVSEVLRLSDDERRDLTSLVVSAVDGRVPVIASVGAESTVGAVRFAHHAVSVGATAVMAIPPVAVSLPDSQVEEYYRAILDAVDVPVVVQDASGYLGRPLPIALYVGLLERYGPEKVQFKPEATPIGPRLSALRDATNGTARVFEGTGGLALVDSFRRGAVGTMPGPEVPWALVALWRALREDEQSTVDRINGPLASLVSLQVSLDSFVAVEKHLLVEQGIFTDARRRRPHAFDMDPETAAEVDRLVSLLREACPTTTPRTR